MPLAPHHRRGALAAMLILLLFAPLMSLPGMARAGASVSPTTVHPGERIHFSADGFTPDERVDLWLTGPDGLSRPRYPAVTADAAGAIIWSYDVPTDAPAGTWTAAARGVRSRLQVPVSFTVLASVGAPTQTVTVTPPAGAGGTTFSFSVSGLTPDTRFAPWVRGPDGRDRELGESGSSPRITVGADGTLRWSWTAPSTALPGPWLTLARAEQSGVLLRVGFTVIGDGPPAPVRRVEPPAAAPGTRFSVTVGGLEPGELVGGWLNTPSGARREGVVELRADAQGVAAWTWSAPADAEAGRWKVVTRGRTSQIEVVLDLTILGNAPAPGPSSVGVGSVEPATVEPLGEVRFQVSGLPQGDHELAYWFTDARGAPVRADERIALDREGRASWTWQAPRLAAPGQWIMTARTLPSGYELRVPFTMRVPNLPGTSVEPTAGSAGTSFTFRASGFNVIEWVDTWVMRPDGVSVDGTFDVRTDGQGVATWSWRAPADAAPGTWTMIVKGRDTNLLHRIPFTIVP